MTILQLLRLSTEISLLMATIGGTLWPQSVTYFVDAAAGNDSFDGKSPATAWRTLAQVNATTFQAGDTVFLKSGSSWMGQLMPKGSGAPGKPIVIDKYGGTAKPLIEGAGVVGTGTVYLNNQEYWEINNLEITNDAPAPGDRRGVFITASDFGTVHHICLKNLEIHHVKGIVGDSDAEKRTAGIGIETATDLYVPTRYDDILIEGCQIYSIENTGLYTDNRVPGARTDYPQTGKWPQRRFTNVRIRNNVIHHISKNAMIIRLLDKGVIEHNVCYETALQTSGNTMFTVSCDGTVFQYNEGYFNRSPTEQDGSMYDADLRSPNTIWQYSYSHDNNHGLIWFWTVAEDSGIIVRYNISQNDKGKIIAFRNDFAGVTIYNNVFYIGSGLSPEIIHERSYAAAAQSYRYYNNVIYNNSTTARYTWAQASRTIDYNVFFGNHPASEPSDGHKMTMDPKLVNPGSGGTGIGSLDGYKLQAGSPCIDSGLQLPDHGGEDYWGNPVPAGGKVDRGAFEYPQGSTGVNDGGTSYPHQVGLAQNFPNPFNPDTNISFQLSSPKYVELSVYDLHGRHVRRICQGERSPGLHNFVWDGTDDAGNRVPSGIYFASLVSRGGRTLIKMALIR